MRESLEAYAAQSKEATVKTQGVAGTVVRFQGPLRIKYEHVKSRMGEGSTDQDCSELAVITVNRAVGPEVLFGVLSLSRAIMHYNGYYRFAIKS